MELLGHTRLNRWVTRGETMRWPGGAHWLMGGHGTGVEKLVEFAARTCYDSQAKAGQSQNFIKGLMKRRHFDVIEHGHIVAGFYGDRHLPADWRNYNRFVDTHELGGDRIVSGNVRCFYDMYQMGHIENKYLMDQLASVAPSIFGVESLMSQPSTVSEGVVDPLVAGEATVIPLAWTDAYRAGYSISSRCRQFTFLIDRISRIATHQLVRHRLMSFSQASQRYIDQAKHDITPIVPPSFSDAQANSLRFRFEQSMELYRSLRKDGVRKEDARFVLPDSFPSRIVVSMTYAAAKHFLKLRCASDAQWEIREIANAIRLHLIQIDGCEWGDDE